MKHVLQQLLSDLRCWTVLNLKQFLFHCFLLSDLCCWTVLNLKQFLFHCFLLSDLRCWTVLNLKQFLFHCFLLSDLHCWTALNLKQFLFHCFLFLIHSFLYVFHCLLLFHSLLCEFHCFLLLQLQLLGFHSAHLPFLKYQEQFHFLVTYIHTFTEMFFRQIFSGKLSCRIPNSCIAVNNLKLYSVDTQFKFITYPDKDSRYEFHLRHDNSGTTLCNTNNPLLCEIFGFQMFLKIQVFWTVEFCHSVCGSCYFEGIMCL